MKFISRYLFESRAAEKTEASAREYNISSIKCLKKCGFTKSGIIRKDAFCEGKYHSSVIISIIKKEYFGNKSQERNNQHIF